MSILPLTVRAPAGPDGIYLMVIYIYIYNLVLKVIDGYVSMDGSSDLLNVSSTYLHPYIEEFFL